MACVAPAEIESSIDEIQRCAALGFKGICLPCKPVFGSPDVDDLNYNLKEFEPLWDCIEDVELPVSLCDMLGIPKGDHCCHGLSAPLLWRVYQQVYPHWNERMS